MVIKTTVRLPPLAFGFGQGFALGTPSRQTCYVPNSEAGKGKREFLHSRKEEKSFYTALGQQRGCSAESAASRGSGVPSNPVFQAAVFSYVLAKL